MNAQRQSQTRRSALWAAYGDALGFITELADEDRVLHRAGTFPVTKPIRWRRKIGGRIGVSIEFPAGSYSDDTQLRLATSRAIRGDGSFDVAAFAKVELPAWANYALGAGVGSKEAAANLSRTSATWYSNFFKNNRASYFSGGGNGAAMRVQPHVWAAADLGDLPGILRDVIRNAICTHGHPRGIVGACFHASSLAHAMATGVAPALDDCANIISRLRTIRGIVDGDTDLRLLWLGPWQENAGVSFFEEVDAVLVEMERDLGQLGTILTTEPRTAYLEAINSLGAKNPDVRGSGTKTSLLAAFAASLAGNGDPAIMLEIVANCLGTDTDTIATMAGAIMGAVSERDCLGALQDRIYIESEAERMVSISNGTSTSLLPYPDLRSWKPARVALDAICLQDGELVLNGVGHLRSLDNGNEQRSKDENLQWFELPFGQTILARVRLNPVVQDGWDKNVVARRSDRRNMEAGAVSRLPDLFARKPGKEISDRSDRELAEKFVPTLNEALQQVIASGFDPTVVGEVLLLQARSGKPDFVEQSIALTATIMTAYEARRRRSK